jgi:hypothetical protein
MKHVEVSAEPATAVSKKKYTAPKLVVLPITPELVAKFEPFQKAWSAAAGGDTSNR